MASENEALANAITALAKIAARGGIDVDLVQKAVAGAVAEKDPRLSKSEEASLFATLLVLEDWRNGHRDRAFAAGRLHWLARRIRTLCGADTPPTVDKIRAAVHTIDQGLAAKPVLDMPPAPNRGRLVVKWNIRDGDECESDLGTVGDLRVLLDLALAHLSSRGGTDVG